MTRMRPRTPLTREQILAALDAANHDVERAATEFLGVSGRTLYRRMAEFDIGKPDRYEPRKAA